MSQPERRSHPITILMADDDEEARELRRDAMQDSRLANQMRFVGDGQELLDYLRRQGRYADASVDAPRPGIILLDLNMPKLDGREALAQIKGDESLRLIPLVILTTSSDEADMRRSYNLCVNSFITNPRRSQGLADVMRPCSRHCPELVQQPPVT